MFSRKTKIICSMGPTTDNDEVVEKVILAGMNIARFNFSHGSHQEHGVRMDRIRRLSAKTGRSVALMMDTKGPEIRTGTVAGDGKITIKAGETVLVTVQNEPVVPSQNGQPAHISLNWKDLPQRVSKGIRILIADGLLELEVQETDGTRVTCRAKNTAAIGSKKNVNIIGLHAGLPIMSPIDREDIAYAVSQDVDFIAASFVSFASEVHEIRKYLDELGSTAHIIAKIENEEGLDNLTEIIAAADGVMVARGDLGVQLPTERIPLAQKSIVRECRKGGKPVIIATQLLDSMIVNPRPTRAELTDVANAILDGTDAVMLSGETANGAYPVEAVETLDRIAKTVEDSDEYTTKMRELALNQHHKGKIGYIMAHMACMTAAEVKATVIIVPTMSGNTARMLSTFHPEQSIMAITPNKKVQRQLMLSWGVVPCLSTIADDSEEMIQNAIKTAIDSDAVHLSDRVVLCAGIPISSPIMVNTVRVILVGNVLARGLRGGFSTERCRVHGRVVKAKSADDAYAMLRQGRAEILVCPTLDDDYVPIMRLVDGIIVEDENTIPDETMKLINPRLIWVAKARGVLKTLESGLTVTLDGKELLVYEGKI